MEWRSAIFQHNNHLRQPDHADNLVPAIRKVDALDKTDVAGANHGDFQNGNLTVKLMISSILAKKRISLFTCHGL